uniref:Dissulfin-02 n=1 Tax=Boana raniceps TaxID=192750 RepID=A0A2L2DDP3_BOARA|nr:dissulfin-02 precursor [Boana raniceps]
MAFLKKSLFLVLFLGLVSLSICEEENREEEREENEGNDSKEEEEGNEEENEESKEKEKRACFLTRLGTYVCG